MVRVMISKHFIQDRQSRDLPCGDVTGYGRNKVTINASPEGLIEMRDDAAYQGWFTDAEPGIIRAARTAFRDFGKYDIPYTKGEKKHFRTGLIMPADAAEKLY